jgi:hypothetical protein
MCEAFATLHACVCFGHASILGAWCRNNTYTTKHIHTGQRETRDTRTEISPMYRGENSRAEPLSKSAMRRAPCTPPLPAPWRKVSSTQVVVVHIPISLSVSVSTPHIWRRHSAIHHGRVGSTCTPSSALLYSTSPEVQTDAKPRVVKIQRTPNKAGSGSLSMERAPERSPNHPSVASVAGRRRYGLCAGSVRPCAPALQEKNVLACRRAPVRERVRVCIHTCIRCASRACTISRTHAHLDA